LLLINTSLTGILCGCKESRKLAAI